MISSLPGLHPAGSTQLAACIPGPQQRAKDRPNEEALPRVYSRGWGTSVLFRLSPAPDSAKQGAIWDTTWPMCTPRRAPTRRQGLSASSGAVRNVVSKEVGRGRHHDGGGSTMFQGNGVPSSSPTFSVFGPPVGGNLSQRSCRKEAVYYYMGPYFRVKRSWDDHAVQGLPNGSPCVAFWRA